MSKTKDVKVHGTAIGSHPSTLHNTTARISTCAELPFQAVPGENTPGYRAVCFARRSTAEDLGGAGVELPSRSADKRTPGGVSRALALGLRCCVKRAGLNYGKFWLAPKHGHRLRTIFVAGMWDL
jgi:hypothetical protein